MLPLTSNFVAGDVVPIPTLPLSISNHFSIFWRPCFQYNTSNNIFDPFNLIRSGPTAVSLSFPENNNSSCFSVPEPYTLFQ